MARTPSTMLPLGTSAPDFTLPDTDGNLVSLSHFAGKPLLVVFTCNHCPFVIHLREVFTQKSHEWLQRGLSIVAISSNDPVGYPEDAPEKMAEYKAKHGFPWPYLFDGSQEVALAYHAACTPDFFLFDAQHHLVYRGQFDASRPSLDIPVTGADLEAAVSALLSGQPIPEPQLPSLGCNIKWLPENLENYAPRYPSL